MLPIIEKILSSSKETNSEEPRGGQNTNKGNGSKELQSDVAKPDIPQQKGIQAGVPKPEGRVLIPAPVDQMQEQFLAALQALKVVEAGAEAGDICTRREYARWLIAASARLSRSPAHKVFPAMYIEGVSKLAYADVLPEDEDFACIQGLAEAGLISSQLLQDVTDEADDESSFFSPDSPLTRQDLVTWKIALERKLPLTLMDSSLAAKRALQELSGFVDIDKIHQDACPALLADIKAGERGIMALAFGYTRRFQPEKPVTKAQAAVALGTGETWELVAEELARLEAESMAEAAVVAELALETKAQQEVAAAFNELLQAEKAKQQETAIMVEKLQTQLEEVKAEREEEKYALLKDRAEIDCERNLLLKMKCDVEQQALLLTNARLEVSFQREQVDKLRAEAEEEREKISKIRAEFEVEKHALTLARIWAEEEARRAFAHSKLLKEVRKRWEYGGVQVHVGKELEDVNIPGPSWHYSDGFQSQRLHMHRLVEKSNNYVQQLKDALFRFFHLVVLFCQSIKQRSMESVGEVNEKIHEVKSNLSTSTARIVAGIKQRLPSVAGLTAIVRESTSKAVAECKGGAEKLVEKLKVS
ncbi:hypothetical protein GOP47_0030903 [Adiantum capillus-veneris]|nr:hypothetical protein GOP47_0030903 [Adiantum capillus-veneris]